MGEGKESLDIVMELRESKENEIMASTFLRQIKILVDFE
jgi:hypothetical protein